MFKRRAYVKAKVAPKRKYTKRPKKAAVSIAKVVKSIMSRTIEQKQSNFTASNLAINGPTGGAPGSGGVYNVMTSIVQGFTQSTRIGNQITPKAGSFKGQINLLPYNHMTNPVNHIDVIMYLVKSKLSNIGTPDWTKIFQLGNSSTGFTATPTDMFQRINTENFRLCTSRKFRLNANNTDAAFTTAGDGISGFAKSFSFPITKYMKKTLKYDDNAAAPLNDNLWLLVVPVQTNGGNVNIQSIEMHFATHFVYTDA